MSNLRFSLSTRWLLAFASGVAVLFLSPSLFGLERLDQDDYAPLVTITFPLDDKSDTTMGHKQIEYMLYSDGTCDNQSATFGGDEKQNGPGHVAWLSRSHKDAVLKLVSKIALSAIMPANSMKAIVLSGPVIKGGIVSRDFSQNIVTIHQMLRLLGGVRGDLGDHLADAIAIADSVDERKEGWNWPKMFGSWTWDDFERQASRPGSEVAALLGSNPKAFDVLISDINHSDGERSERDTALLAYLDCKMGHKTFIDELTRQDIKKRKRGSTDLLGILTFKQDVPSGFEDLAKFLRETSE